MELAVKRSIGDEANLDIENMVRVAFAGKAMGGLRTLDWVVGWAGLDLGTHVPFSPEALEAGDEMR